jgi:6-phosphogluconolactonase
MRTLLTTITLSAAITMNAQDYTVYVGAYTGPNASKGIYKFGFNSRSGEVTAPIDLAVETESPSFIAIHQNGRFLYAVNETGAFAGKKQGAVSAFSINPGTHQLTALNQQPSLGADPCHINVDREGRNVMIANYTGGSVAVYPIDGDGGLKMNSSFIQHTGAGTTKRQAEPHAHSINLDKSGRYAFVCDLGLDKVFIYNYNSSIGKLTESGFGTLKPGSGPRHLALSSDGKLVYVISELASTLTSFSYDGARGLKEIETVSTLPEPTPGNSTAEVVIHPGGKFVYGSNRGHNSIAVFTTDSAGHLKLVQNASVEGKTPRNFVVDPSGQFLIAANQDSNNITFFKIDSATGKLTYTGKSLQAFKPVCLRFLANK